MAGKIRFNHLRSDDSSDCLILLTSCCPESWTGGKLFFLSSSETLTTDGVAACGLLTDVCVASVERGRLGDGGKAMSAKLD